MYIVKVSIELGIDGEDFLLNHSSGGNYYDKDKIANYLNDKLYMDPEFFGDFGPENIDSIRESE
jgi:hypothetical protein